jgi:drug/metabolite transporter (DMT)-like permease
MARHSLGLAPSVSLVLASAFWAVGTVISKELLTSLPPVAFLVLQLAPSVIVLWLLVVAKGMPSVRWCEVLPIAALGWLNPGLSYTLSMLGLTQTSASVATLLWAAEPALIVALAWLVLRESITARLLCLTATAGCGVLLVSGVLDLETVADGGGYGAALILGGVLCCALYTVLSRRIVTTADPLFIVALQQTVGLIWAAAIWPLEGSSPAEFAALPARCLD